MDLSFLSQFASAHPFVFAFVVWPALSALVTGVAGALGHLSSDDFAKMPAWLALPMRMLAAYGADAPRILAALAKLFGKAAPPAAVLLLAMALGAGSSACSLLQSPQAPTIAGLVENDAICVIQHDQEPVLQILSDCHLAQDVLQIVQDLVSATHAAEARARLGDQGGDGGIPWHVDASAGK